MCREENGQTLSVYLFLFMDMYYNHEKKKLQLPEYGRHVQHMVDYLRTIDDRDLRNEQARVVIEVMGNINPLLRDTADFTHKLWDHLFIMADFQLDVDSPYPIPSRDMLYPKPDKLPYPDRKITRKHYGKNMQNMLKELKNIEDEGARNEIAVSIAKYMRAKSYEYNQEYPNNEIIIRDIRAMSDNATDIDENAINNLRIDYKQPQNNNRGKKNFSQNTTGRQNQKGNFTNKGGKHRSSQNQSSGNNGNGNSGSSRKQHK